MKLTIPKLGKYDPKKSIHTPSSNEDPNLIDSCYSIPFNVPIEQEGIKLPELNKRGSASLEEAEKYLENGDILMSLKSINQVISEKSESTNVKALQFRALINYKLEKYD